MFFEVDNIFVSFGNTTEVQPTRQRDDERNSIREAAEGQRVPSIFVAEEFAAEGIRVCEGFQKGEESRDDENQSHFGNACVSEMMGQKSKKHATTGAVCSEVRDCHEIQEDGIAVDAHGVRNIESISHVKDVEEEGSLNVVHCEGERSDTRVNREGVVESAVALVFYV